MRNVQHSPVKKANIRIKYTKEQVLELRKCSKDPQYFIENYCQVIHPKSGKLVYFKLYPYQTRFVEAMTNHKDVIALFPRQSGKTETAVSYMIWFAMFKPNQNILIAAHKFEHVSEIMKRIKQVYEGLPFWLKTGVLKDGYNARSVKFDNGSVIQGTATTANSGRGKTINLLYLDEFAFLKPNIAKEFWASIQPTLAATQGKCIITSTPNNDSDEFASIWFGAINVTDEYGNSSSNGLGRNGFKAVSASWDEHPDRDEEWKEEQYAKIGDERWRREFELQFISFDETLINPVFINEELSRMGSEPMFKLGSVRWYSKIQPNKIYLVSLDPSLGTGHDYSAIQIFQLPELIQIGEWKHNRTDPRGQIRILMDILKYIDTEMSKFPNQIIEKEIYWSVENNNIGETSLMVIDDTGEDSFPGTFLTESRKPGAVRIRKGFNTTNKKKIEACSRLKSLVEDKKMKINSKALIRELKFFVAHGNTFKAKSGEHDDLVMSTILITRMVDEILKWEDSELQELSRSIGEYEEHIEPMPTIII